jgi:hypothetical protein
MRMGIRSFTRLTNAFSNSITRGSTATPYSKRNIAVVLLRPR